MENIAATLFVVESEVENRLWVERTYTLGSDRKVVVRDSKLTERISADAYIRDPHDHVWYDGDGEERVERREWRLVSHDTDAPRDVLLARAWGVLMCYRA